MDVNLKREQISGTDQSNALDLKYLKSKLSRFNAFTIFEFLNKIITASDIYEWF